MVIPVKTDASRAAIRNAILAQAGGEVVVQGSLADVMAEVERQLSRFTHTAYQVVVYLPKERIIFTGDNVVNKTPPLFHSAVHPEAWLESLGFIQNMDLDFIIPGHGEVCDKEVLSKFMENIRTIMESVQSCMNMGLGKEETKKTVSYVNRFWIPPGMEERYQMLQSMSIGNIYDRLQEGKGQRLGKKASGK